MLCIGAGARKIVVARAIGNKGQDILTLGSPKETKAHRKERQRIARECHEFYRWLVQIESSSAPPGLTIQPEAHVLTVGDGKFGFAAYAPTINQITVAVRGKHEASESYEEAVQLCLESVAHEFYHYLQHGGKKSFREREAERYARRVVKEYLNRGS